MSNYTKEMVNTLTEAAPVSYEMALEFAREWGLTARSVIAKVKSLNLEYIPKPAPAKKARPDAPTKAKLAAALYEMVKEDLEEQDGPSQYLFVNEVKRAGYISLAALVELVGRKCQTD